MTAHFRSVIFIAYRLSGEQWKPALTASA